MVKGFGFSESLSLTGNPESRDNREPMKHKGSDPNRQSLYPSSPPRQALVETRPKPSPMCFFCRSFERPKPGLPQIPNATQMPK